MSEKKSNSNKFGLTGVAIGIIALGMALFHFWLGPISAPPPMEETISDQAVKIKRAVEAKIKGDEYKAPSTNSNRFDGDRIADIATIAAGFLAIVLAVVSFIRHESIRVSGSAVALGGGAIAFQFLTVALGVIVFVILIAVVLNQLGIDIG